MHSILLEKEKEKDILNSENIIKVNSSYSKYDKNETSKNIKGNIYTPIRVSKVPTEGFLYAFNSSTIRSLFLIQEEIDNFFNG